MPQGPDQMRPQASSMWAVRAFERGMCRADAGPRSPQRISGECKLCKSKSEDHILLLFLLIFCVFQNRGTPPDAFEWEAGAPRQQ